MFLDTLLIALIYAFLKKRKFKSLGDLYIEKWYLLGLGFVLSILPDLLLIFGNQPMVDFIIAYFSYIHILTYLLLIYVVYINRGIYGLKLVFIGTSLNLIPIIFNGGKMPVSLRALEFAKLNKLIYVLNEKISLTHRLMDPETKFTFLSDIIPIPKPYFFPKVISLGDIFISIGLFILLIKFMDKE